MKLTFSGPCIVIYLIIEANKMHYFSTLFGKQLYMFRTDLLSIIRSLNNVFTATGICHTEILKMDNITSVCVCVYIHIYTHTHTLSLNCKT